MKIQIILFIRAFFLITILTAQEKSKDTLFFKLDNQYIYESKYSPKSYLLKDSDSNETFFFEEIEMMNNLRPKKVLNIKKFVVSSAFYHKKRKVKLSAYGLWEYLNGYVVVLVKDDNENKKYIKVKPNIQLE
ncbi:hypothetical protein [Flavobacterium sp. N502540]|uniref:hypothetical protein n=1 Tax=Flavobacterium sp. N502540 TaxID=2986838 RepID=UPI002224FF99|nr:hypothetical protein [Flavobacterium sp. N502540]